MQSCKTVKSVVAYRIIKQLKTSKSFFFYPSRFGPWEVISYDGNNTYQINLCGRVPAYSAGVGKPSCHNDTVVCMVQDGHAFSLANYTNNTINAPSNDEEAEMWIVRNGDGCPDLAGENLNSIINLKCGKTLVSKNP